MTKQKVGLVLFWIGFIWAILWGSAIGFIMSPAFSSLTLAEINQSVWAITGPLFIIWGAFGATLGAIIAGVGVLLYSGAKASTMWKFGLGVFFAFIINIMVLPALGYFPLMFGVLGTLILLLFMGVAWLWAKERIALKDSSTTAMDFRLAGYVFMLMATWFT